jgi:protein involved in ribonucleotide reduction
MKKLIPHSILVVLFFITHVTTSGKSQFGFIKNNGQIIDQNNQANTSVKYLYNGNGLNVQLRDAGFSYELFKSSKVLKDFSSLEAINKNINDSFNYVIESHRIDIVFEGASANLDIVPLLAQNSLIHFYTTGINSDGIIGVNHFYKVMYKNIYPNIDIEFVVTENNTKSGFKYNFVLHPGARIEDIKLKINGANSTAIDEDGSISMVSALGIIEEKIPYSFQITNGAESAIKARFKKTGNNLFGIDAPNYDVANTLVIDPTPWATYFGGAQNDLAYDVTTDTLNNIYTTGITYSSSNIATSGAFQNTYLGGSDIFLSKHNENGQLLWATYVGGTGDDFSYSVGTDDSLNVYIGGSTRSSSIHSQAGTYIKPIVIRFNSNGVRFWTSNFYISENEEILDIAIGSDSYIYLAGYSLQKSYWINGYTNIREKAYASGRIKKFPFGNPSGLGLFPHSGSLNSYAELNSVTLDSLNNVYMSGSSEKTLTSLNSYPTVFNSPNNGFLIKNAVNSSNSWVRYFAGAPKCVTRVFKNDIALIESNNVNSYITHLNSNGGLVRSTRLDNTTISQIKPAGGYHFIVSGYTATNYNLSSPNAYQKFHAHSFNYLNTNNDAVLMKFDSSGNKIWGTYYGSNGNDYATSLAVSKNNQIVLVGNTNSTTKISTSLAANTRFSGVQDAFITLLSDSGHLAGISNNVITTNNRLCNTSNTVLINGSTPDGVNGTINYLWLKSTLGADTGYAVAPGINNTKDYTLTSNTAAWYKRVVIIGADKDTSLPRDISFYAHPGGGFLLSRNNICQASSTLFTDTSTFTRSKTEMFAFPAIGNYNSHLTYQEVGTFSIRLVNHNNGCIDTISKNITVLPKPFVGFTINKNIQALNGNAFQLNDTSIFAGSSYSRTWSFSKDIADTSNIKTPIKTYSTLGYNLIQLKVIGNNLCSDSTTKQVAVCNNIENNTISTSTANCNSSTILGSMPTGGFIGVNEDFSDFNALPNNWSSVNIKQTTVHNLYYGSPQGPWIPNYNLVNSYWRPGPKGAAYVFSDPNTYLESPIFTATKVGGKIKFDVYDNVAPHKYGNTTPMKFDTVIVWAKTNGFYQIVKKYAGYEIFSGAPYSISSILIPDSIHWTTIETVLPTGTTQVKFTFFVGGNYYGPNRLFLDRIILDTTIQKSISWLSSPTLNGTYLPASGTASGNNFISNTAGSRYYKRIYNTGEYSDTSSAVLINIYPKPNVNFNINNAEQCLNRNQFNFTNNSTIATGGIINKYTWKLGDADTSSFTSIASKIYNTAGNYTIKLFAYTTNNCIDSATKSIQVHPNPSIGYVFNSQVGSSSQVIFMDTTSNVKNRMWTFGKMVNDTAKISIQKFTSNSVVAVKLLVESQQGCIDSVYTRIKTLPVSWLKIAAKRTQETEAIITWSTGNETNNSHFEIECSYDLKNWKTIGKVIGNGNSTIVRNYQFIDKNASQSVINYRIKQIDFDGNFEYTKVVSINANVILNNTEVKVYPNPFTNSITVEQLDGINSDVAYLYDITGRLIQQFPLHSNLENLSIDNDLNSGIYSLKVNETTYKITKIAYIK